MRKNRYTACLALFLSCWSSNHAHASERVVLVSAPSKTWHQHIYLMADQITWMDYENFAIQVGDMGQMVYHFPQWYHGKYEPKLYAKDISGDGLDDVIVVLNNDKANLQRPRRDLHILNRIADQGYEEVSIESLQQTKKMIAQHTKLKKQANIVTICIEDKKYTLDISKYQYENPREPFFIGFQLIDYTIQNQQLFGAIPIYVSRDAATGGLIGYFKLQYVWNKREYQVKKIEFVPYDVKDDQFSFPEGICGAAGDE